MKQELLNYLAGLSQAGSAALLASAVIMPDMRTQSLVGCAIAAVAGVAVILKMRSIK